MVLLCQAVGAIGIVYELAPPSLGRPDPLRFTEIGGELNEVWREA